MKTCAPKNASNWSGQFSVIVILRIKGRKYDMYFWYGFWYGEPLEALCVLSMMPCRFFPPKKHIHPGSFLQYLGFQNVKTLWEDYKTFENPPSYVLAIGPCRLDPTPSLPSSPLYQIVFQRRWRSHLCLLLIPPLPPMPHQGGSLTY